MKKKNERAYKERKNLLHNLLILQYVLANKKLEGFGTLTSLDRSQCSDIQITVISRLII